MFLLNVWKGRFFCVSISKLDAFCVKTFEYLPLSFQSVWKVFFYTLWDNNWNDCHHFAANTGKPFLHSMRSGHKAKVFFFYGKSVVSSCFLLCSLLDVPLSPTVTSLNLHCNHIPGIEGLTSAWHLRHLDLSSNCISRIEGLSSLTSLRTLNVSCNLITKVEGESLVAHFSLTINVLWVFFSK